MAKEVDIVALGELLIDFTEVGKSIQEKSCLSKILVAHRQIF